MLLRLDRRLLAGMTAVLFALSVVGHAIMMAEIAGKAAAAPIGTSVQNPMSDGDNCSGVAGDAAAQTSCGIHCASVVGIASDPVRLSIAIAAKGRPPVAVRPLSDRAKPPDPPPPKAAIVI